MLDEGLKMTTPVKPGSTTTKDERKKKAAEQAADAAGNREGLHPPRMDLTRPGARGGTRSTAMVDEGHKDSPRI